MNVSLAVEEYRARAARRLSPVTSPRQRLVAANPLVGTFVGTLAGGRGDVRGDAGAARLRHGPGERLWAAVVLSIGRLGHGRAAADYYLQRQAGCGCGIEYYTGSGEPRGVWCGSDARGERTARTLDAAGEALLRNLLAGCDGNGQPLVSPVWRGDPRGRVPAAVLVRAVERAASERHLDPSALLGDEGLVRAFEAARSAVGTDERLPRRPRAALPAPVASRIARAAGLDPVEVFRSDDGRDVLTAALPFAERRVDVRRSGLDLTFSAPKSVSVLFGLGDEQVVEQVRAAHQAAVEQTIAYLEGLCARAARGHHTPGQPYQRIATTGWAAVAFEHRSSRAGDPQLHTHVVVPNVVCGVDGKWSAWDTSEAYRQASTGGYLYQAVLRGELSRRLGVGWGPVRHGVAEISGVPPGLRRMFSTRRAEIEEHLALHGQSGPQAATVALFETRQPKSRRSEADLRADWRQRARAASFGPRRLIAEVRQAGRTTTRRVLDVATIAGQVLGEGGVTSRSSTFDRRVLLRAVCEAVPAGSPVTVESLRGIATQVVRDPAVVPLVGDAPVEIRRYSTADLLVTEAAALRSAVERTNDGVGVVPADTVERSLLGAGLSGDQDAAVRRILSSGAGVEVVVGPAGAGKTAALRVAYAAWQQAGVEVRGAALAAIAARTLQTGTGIPSQSLTRLTRAIRSGDLVRGLPPAGGVLVVDEAGMVGTRDLAWLDATTKAAQVKLVLVGDPAQLAEIDAGGLFAGYIRALPCTRLSGNLRQREPWERDALALLRDGDVLTALDAYDGAGRVHLHEDGATAKTAIVADYLSARETGASVVMLASRRTDARKLNTLVRRALLADGRLGRRPLLVRVDGQRVDWRVGDEAVITRNDYPLELINGSRGRISRISRGGVTVDTETGPVHVPRSLLEAGVLTYGYALTVHKAQGITVDVALLYASGTLTRESGYVGLSRGRAANHLYGTLEALLPEVDAEIDRPADDPINAAERVELTRAAVVARLETRGSQRLALTQADDTARDYLHRWMHAGPERGRAAGISR
jgi:conjugative relaxase-like TrwC/TraI family protein